MSTTFDVAKLRLSVNSHYRLCSFYGANRTFHYQSCTIIRQICANATLFLVIIAYSFIIAPFFVPLLR